ncbi:MAG: hypothetical protein JST35_00225 [Armatimonadetes bacterium]|nr:hypothetical protein [Armatimonadota bacterium]
MISYFYSGEPERHGLVELERPESQQRLGFTPDLFYSSEDFNFRHPEFCRAVEEVGGLEFKPLGERPRIGVLPELIPTLPSPSAARLLQSVGPDELFAARFQTIRSGGRRTIPSSGPVINFHERSSGAYLVHGEWKDKTQLSLLTTAKSGRLIVDPQAILVPPIFSVYTDGTQLRELQLLNLKRSLYFAELMSAAGYTVIPGIGVANDTDVGRLVEWMHASTPKVTHLAMNCQMGPKALRAVVRDAAKICKESSLPVHFVLFGPSSRTSFAQVYEHLPPERVTFVTQAAWHRARTTLSRGERQNPILLLRQYLDKLHEMELDRQWAAERAVLRNGPYLS